MADEEKQGIMTNPVILAIIVIIVAIVILLLTNGFGLFSAKGGVAGDTKTTTASVSAGMTKYSDGTYVYTYEDGKIITFDFRSCTVTEPNGNKRKCTIPEETAMQAKVLEYH